MPPVRRTTGRATRRRRRPNYRDRSSVPLPPISKDSADANATITFTAVRERIRANADAYGREIVGPRMTPCVGREIRALDTRGIIDNDNDFESETLQLTPAGRRKFDAIEADAVGAVASDASEGATLAALFDASRVRMGPGQMGRALDEKDRTIEELRDRLRRRDQGKHSLATPLPTPGSFIRALPPDVVRRVDELQLLRSNHPAGPAESNAQVRTPRRLSGAKSMPYPSPESLPRRRGVGAAPVSPPPSPSPSRGASPMDVDDDDADEVLVALSLVPTPSTSASICAPRQTNDAEVQCDPSETETQLADVRADLLEAQAKITQAELTISKLKDQIRTLSSQQQTWNANKAELEALREAKNKADEARLLWSQKAARLAEEIKEGF
ncbi:hypothetical protein B0H14DRAFT_2871875 [Mycena olivaceomarginata]|nr:hypothetical protein B0H14DRAFT_2871875 [Mycena olivaceomarginata]